MRIKIILFSLVICSAVALAQDVETKPQAILPTPYLLAETITPSAWWSCRPGPDEVTYSCDGSVACGGECGRKYKNIVETEICCDEAGNCHTDVTGGMYIFVGCGCGGGPCLNPIQEPEPLTK